MLAVGLAIAHRAAPSGSSTASLVAYGRVPSIIVTLGTLAIYRTWLIDHAERAHHHRRLAAPVAGRVPATDGVQHRRARHPPGVRGRGGRDRAPSRSRWAGSAGAAGSTPSAPTPRRPGRRACPSELVTLGAFVAVRRARPAWPASCSWPASGRSRWPPAGPRAGLGRRGRGRRGQHPRRLGHAGRGAARRGADRPARPEPGAGARGQRVLARRRPRRAHPARRRHRLRHRQAAAAALDVARSTVARRPPEREATTDA